MGKHSKTKKTNNKLLGAIVVVMALVVTMPLAFAFYYFSTMYSLVLVGDDDISLNLNGVYEEQGATAIVDGEDASADVVIEGEVDTQTPGTYTVKYSIGTLNLKRTVNVGDKMSPIIDIGDTSKLTVKLGEDVAIDGYKATDENGRDLTDKVEVDQSTLTKAGEGQISYTVSDSDGNTTRVFRDVTVEPNTDYGAPGLPICMYHYVYDENNPPEDLHKRYGNYISAQALEEEINWLKSENYYFPTWDEVRAYIDGELLLPDKSIVLTFDDGSKSFLEYGIPVLEKCQVVGTSFVITKNKGAEKVAKYQSDYVSFQSHSDNMHIPGGNVGHGGIFTALSKEEAVADLQKSISIVGNGDAFAYPYGDYNDSCVEAVEEAGFKCAVTTQPGKAKPGQNPYLLPRQRMSLGQSLDKFQAMVKPPATSTDGN